MTYFIKLRLEYYFLLNKLGLYTVTEVYKRYINKRFILRFLYISLIHQGLRYITDLYHSCGGLISFEKKQKMLFSSNKVGHVICKVYNLYINKPRKNKENRRMNDISIC